MISLVRFGTIGSQSGPLTDGLRHNALLEAGRVGRPWQTDYLLLLVVNFRHNDIDRWPQLPAGQLHVAERGILLLTTRRFVIFLLSHLIIVIERLQ